MMFRFRSSRWVPGRQIGWMSRFGEQLNLPLEGSGGDCDHTGERYNSSMGA